jgi:hypothetical protein
MALRFLRVHRFNISVQSASDVPLLLALGVLPQSVTATMRVHHRHLTNRHVLRRTRRSNLHNLFRARDCIRQRAIIQLCFLKHEIGLDKYHAIAGELLELFVVGRRNDRAWRLVSPCPLLREPSQLTLLKTLHTLARVGAGAFAKGT